mmetsp:Transcript_80309/g.227443  ORF Transcript_80309/g.227443 Transcript_80309/m.227443 type:complete len:229 (-) Transcript_80309:23-709(-)
MAFPAGSLPRNPPGAGGGIGGTPPLLIGRDLAGMNTCMDVCMGCMGIIPIMVGTMGGIIGAFWWNAPEASGITKGDCPGCPCCPGGPPFRRLKKLRVTYAEALRTVPASCRSRPATAVRASCINPPRRTSTASPSSVPSSCNRDNAPLSSWTPGASPREVAVLTAVATNADGFRTCSARPANRCRMLRASTGSASSIRARLALSSSSCPTFSMTFSKIDGMMRARLLL